MRKFQVPFERDKAENAGEVDFFTCHIAGEPWRYGLVTKEQMKLLAEGTSHDADGLCDAHLGHIYICAGGVTHPTVIHELCHAYLFQSQICSASLTADQTEEVMCDIFAYNWCKIALLARIIVANLMAYEEYLRTKKNQDWEECPADVVTRRLPEHLLELIATYATGGANPLLKAAIGKKKRGRASKT